MLRCIGLFLLLTLAGPRSAFSQRPVRVISGLVSSREDGTHLEGVVVTSASSISGSQQDGAYYIEVTDRDSLLVFTCKGYASRQLKLTSANEYDIQLDKCVQGRDQTASFSPTGYWRAVFQLRPDLAIPIIFDIHKDCNGVNRVFFHNGEACLEGGRVEQTRDSFFIFLDPFDGELAFRIDDEDLAGVLRRRNGVSVPVRAATGIPYRFKETGIGAAANLSGVYDLSFSDEKGKRKKMLGLFKQEGNKLDVTLIGEVRDTRYLEGIVEENQFFLSSFAGSTPVYFNGSFTLHGNFTGEMQEIQGSQRFSGTPRSNDAALK
ncbi:MAG TPA: hypothetical protein VHD83_10195 [Puia sp.]|nr:hypothetical protein [Puia sp.]